LFSARTLGRPGWGAGSTLPLAAAGSPPGSAHPFFYPENRKENKEALLGREWEDNKAFNPGKAKPGQMENCLKYEGRR